MCEYSTYSVQREREKEERKKEIDRQIERQKDRLRRERKLDRDGKKSDMLRQLIYVSIF